MSTDNRRAFYSSKVWTGFLKSLRLERIQPDGQLICEHCGKPILKSYDCIGHHITELTEENVCDASIALNPANVMLIHFRCHNEIHRRFGYHGKTVKQVFIVYGAPCAGKSTWVRENADADDLVLDLDRLWQAVRAESCGRYDKPDAVRHIVFDLRDCIIDDIRTRRGKWRNAYIIGGYPLEAERQRLSATVGADKLIFIDTPEEICRQRAGEKSADWVGYVADWFSRYSPPGG